MKEKHISIFFTLKWYYKKQYLVYLDDMQRLSINMLKNLVNLEDAVEKEYQKKIEEVNVEGAKSR